MKWYQPKYEVRAENLKGTGSFDYKYTLKGAHKWCKKHLEFDDVYIYNRKTKECIWIQRSTGILVQDTSPNPNKIPWNEVVSRERFLEVYGWLPEGEARYVIIGTHYSCELPDRDFQKGE